MGLTPEQATQDAVTVLKAAGFGREHKRPIEVQSWALGRDNFGTGHPQIRTQVKTKAAHLDDAVRALLAASLPGAVACGIGTTTVTVDRDADAGTGAPVCPRCGTASCLEDKAADW